MPGVASKLVTTLAAGLAACGAYMCAAAYAAEGAPTGAWRTTNKCFLAGFFLIDGGLARAAYLSGEGDDNATWTWDGGTLTITSMMFPLDRFSGHMAADQIEADYVWHDLETDQLNRQSCVFERFTPGI